VYIWKSGKILNGYEGYYQISNQARVISFPRKGTSKEIKEIKQFKNRYGYVYVTLHKDNKHKKYTVHQLMAQAFIDNPNNLPQVNHKDGNKENNSIDNLEWVSASGNKKHSYDHLKEKHYSRKVLCVEKRYSVR
jgi:hypothetical protein